MQFALKLIFLAERKLNFGRGTFVARVLSPLVNLRGDCNEAKDATMESTEVLSPPGVAGRVDAGLRSLDMGPGDILSFGTRDGFERRRHRGRQSYGPKSGDGSNAGVGEQRDRLLPGAIA